MTKHTTITGQTCLVGLIGWPVEHSLSPAMHNAAFEALGLNWCYLPLPVHPAQIGAAVRGLGALGFAGANVTVPHKQAVIPHLSSISPRAEQLGAINTIVTGRKKDGRMTISGFNTDDKGFIRALREGGFEPSDRHTLVLGAGGAARAVVFGLLWSGVSSVVVLNRTQARAQKLVDEFTAFQPNTPLIAGPLSPAMLEEHTQTADLLVNATSIGMWPQVERSPWPEDLPLPAHLTVCDLVYNPRQTRLLRQAQAVGAHPIDGLGMLVNQAALAFEMWTGEWPPVEVMWNAANEHFQKD